MIYQFHLATASVNPRWYKIVMKQSRWLLRQDLCEAHLETLNWDNRPSVLFDDRVLAWAFPAYRQ